MLDKIAPEFSRLIDVGKIPPRGMTVEINAKPDERAALCKRLGLVALEDLTANLELQAEGSGARQAVSVRGSFSAKVTQQCVITLEPLPALIGEPLIGLFAAQRTAAKNKPKEENTDIMEDQPEPIVNGMVDIGELVTQYLALALEPYPRKPGVAMDFPNEADHEPAREHPFAKLADLVKDKKTSGE